MKAAETIEEQAREYANKVICDTDYDKEGVGSYDHPYWSDEKTEDMVNDAYLAGAESQQHLREENELLRKQRDYHLRQNCDSDEQFERLKKHEDSQLQSETQRGGL